MTSIEDRKRELKLSNAFLGGERILGVKYRHNSQVTFSDADGSRVLGWIVSVGPVEPHPIYTVERTDGQGDVEIAESELELVFDPHEDGASHS
ncbi:MAG: hypothetical protein NXI26_26455 [bacterium]|nr:hypothetical protein [bacterium]